MPRYKLANIIFSGVPQLVSTPALCCRADAQLLAGGQTDAARLCGPGHFDFCTYFNALSVGKWKAYTVARRFFLHIAYRGAAATLTQTSCNTFSWYARALADGKGIHTLAASEDWQEADIELVCAEGDLLEGFSIDAEGPLEIRGSYYYTELEESQVRPVELAICTTTFKKEAYIGRNIGLMRKQVLESDDDIARHFQMHVVDNGRTLDAAGLSGGGVFVYPNDNVGGAGGFARGMIEAMRAAKPATHVLLMDDDVTISPESVIRTYNLLRIVNNEYAEAFVSGAMLNFDEPARFLEDTGYMTYDGVCRAIKDDGRAMLLDVLHDCVRLEASGPHAELRGWGDRAQQYAAWWYCCIPVSTVEREGMPLPLFVRYDDAEYGLRCKPRFMTMTGICVWHEAFRMRYNPAAERYQTARNGLIIQATTGAAANSNFLEAIRLNFELDLKKFNYKDAELTLEGIEDYLQGPDCCFARGFAERRFMDANRNKEKLIPLEEVARQVEAEHIDVDLAAVNGTFLEPYVNRSKKESLADYVSVNGQRVIPSFTKPGKAAVIEAAGWTYPAYNIRQCEVIVALGLDGTTGVVRRKDEAKFKELWKRYKADLKELSAKGEQVKALYASWRQKVTSVDYWMGYLGIE